MNPNNKKAFTLTEILVVLVIMGFLVALVAPKFAGTLDFAKAELNKSQMEEIKRASLEFYKDTGFVADNVTLLTYPWEKCTVDDKNYDGNSSDLCINMIAFIDKHYKDYTENTEIRDNAQGDNGSGTLRKDTLNTIIQNKLDPNTGWKGGYIGGNEVIKAKNLKKLGTSANESNNLYFFSNQDLKVFDGNDHNNLYDIYNTKWNLTTANDELYPVFASGFDGTTDIKMDELYENAHYSKDNDNDGNRREIDEDGNGELDFADVTFFGAMTILDPYGTPYEIQIPTASALTAYDSDEKLRTKYARIVSFGKDRRRDTPIDVVNIDYTDNGYDDSVLYIFSGHGLQNHFHPEDEE